MIDPVSGNLHPDIPFREIRSIIDAVSVVETSLKGQVGGFSAGGVPFITKVPIRLVAGDRSSGCVSRHDSVFIKDWKQPENRRTGVIHFDSIGGGFDITKGIGTSATRCNWSHD